MSSKADLSAGNPHADMSHEECDEVSLKEEAIEAAASDTDCHQDLDQKGDAAGQQPPLVFSPAVAAASLPATCCKKTAAKICEELSKRRSIKVACANSKNFPEPHIVRKWAMEDLHGFAIEYAKARELGFLAMADEPIEIVDQLDGNITRDKLRVDARKWLLSKAIPDGFGDMAGLKATVKMSLSEDEYELGKKIAFALELSSRGTSDFKYKN